jgi:hypothetical protein
MKPLFEDVLSWSVYSKQKRLDFNGHLLRSEKETVIVDPPPMEPDDREKLHREARPFHILLTNKDHQRDSQELRRQLEAEIWIHEADAGMLDEPPDRTFQDGERLPGGLRAVHVPDNKSPGDTAFHLDRHEGILILGDTLIGHPIGELSLLPEEKFADVEKARAGIRVLMDLSYEIVLVGDGLSIFRNGRDAVQRFLERE